VYSPSITREELMSRLIHEVVSSVPGGHTDHLLSAFVDFAARADETHLQRLERLIAERRKKGSDNGI